MFFFYFPEIFSFAHQSFSSYFALTYLGDFPVIDFSFDSIVICGHLKYDFNNFKDVYDSLLVNDLSWLTVMGAYRITVPLWLAEELQVSLCMHVSVWSPWCWDLPCLLIFWVAQLLIETGS